MENCSIESDVQFVSEEEIVDGLLKEWGCFELSNEFKGKFCVFCEV